MNKRVFTLCILIIALALGLSTPNPAASLFGGQATNLTEDGICSLEMLRR